MRPGSIKGGMIADLVESFVIVYFAVTNQLDLRDPRDGLEIGVQD